MRHSHTPLGYRIEDGKAVISPEEAAQVQQIYTGYLGGLSLKRAAESAGLKMIHASVKRLLQNKHYLGDDFYPAIIDREIFHAVETERKRRKEALGRNNLPKKEQLIKLPPTRFRMATRSQVFPESYKQAEYLYSLIESED